MKQFIYLTICAALWLTACSAKKQSVTTKSMATTSVSSSLSVEHEKTSASKNILKDLSLDSIEIFIKKTWGAPYASEKLSPAWPHSSLAIPPDHFMLDSVRGHQSTLLPYSESVAIKAYKLNSSSVINSSDSSERSGSLLSCDSISTEISVDSASSSSSTAVFQPPDALKMVGFAFSIAAIILLLVLWLKRKSNC